MSPSSSCSCAGSSIGLCTRQTQGVTERLRHHLSRRAQFVSSGQKSTGPVIKIPIWKKVPKFPTGTIFQDSLLVRAGFFHSANGSKTTHSFAPRSRFERESGVTTPSSKENALEAKILRFTGNLYFFTRGGVHFDHLFAILRNRFVLFRNGA